MKSKNAVLEDANKLKEQVARQGYALYYGEPEYYRLPMYIWVCDISGGGGIMRLRFGYDDVLTYAVPWKKGDISFDLYRGRSSQAHVEYNEENGKIQLSGTALSNIPKLIRTYVLQEQGEMEGFAPEIREAIQQHRLYGLNREETQGKELRERIKVALSSLEKQLATINPS